MYLVGVKVGYIALGLVLATRQGGLGRRTLWWRTYACAGGIAWACYLLYAWYFYPLAHPYLFLLFAKHQPIWEGEWTAPLSLSMCVVGGWLWIGGGTSLIAMTRWSAARLAGAWGGMTLLPTVPYLISHVLYTVPLQVRMLTVPVVLPLLLASTLGWVFCWQASHRWLRYSVVAVTVAAVVLSVIALMPAFERLPGWLGLGMLPRIRAFFLVPRYTYCIFRRNLRGGIHLRAR